ncbi:MAG: hypothetical protein JWO95_3716 [Verrucomicrobiales bacterium]|nr:hypothetical protein [Verrucomicrobiales bacterium]
MENLRQFCKYTLAMLCLALLILPAQAITLPNPVVFVTQPPIARELNGSVSNTFLSVVTIFGNHLPDTAHAARGGDLWLAKTNGAVLNLTRAAGYGVNGVQHTNGIDVRDPQIFWDGSRAIFSMVVGSPRFSGDTNIFFWQLYELTNLTAVIASNATPVIVKVSNQPTNYNNISPCYGSDGRIIFTSDRSFNGQTWLYPQRDEYKGAPTVTGTYSLDPSTGNLRMLEHLPSGVFNPFVDSFGRLIVTRWDHLVQDSSAADDRLGRGTNGAFTFISEASNSVVLPSNPLETFPEPVDFDTNYAAALGVNVNGFNLLLPWALDQVGGNEEVLNHVGRHELSQAVLPSFPNEPNLIAFTNPAARPSFGINSSNTNYIQNFVQITEDPLHPGTYFGVDAQDISIFGGAHAAGQIVSLTGAAGLNPTNMVLNYITPKASSFGPNTSVGLFRNPLPMSDGSLLAAYTRTFTATNFGGWDTNLGTASAPTSMYQFRLMTLTKSGAIWVTNALVTTGLTNIAIYWDGTTLVTNAGPLWELQPVEVRSRSVPPLVVTPPATIEQQVFASESVDMPTFQADLAQRGLALVVSRNVTARDAADKQQPYNLSVPGGVTTLGTNSGKTYNITHLQFLEADYLRGYNFGSTNTVQPGRRILATPISATAAYNYTSTATNAPIGGTQLMSDGSQATIVPAGRAVTWQLTGVTNESIVKERYWLNFRAGEIRTCANCHGINDKDQAGRSSPTNAPLALRQFLRYWRTNAASAYALTVNNGSGSGNVGAGSIVSLSANPAPSGQIFSQWTGAVVSNAFSPTTLFTMPANNATVTAVYSNLPSPVVTGAQILNSSNFVITATGFANQPWVLQASTDLAAWIDLSTNIANGSGQLQITNLINPNSAQGYFRLKSP